ncbi:MAG: hypothetical protein M1831_007423 [Alyxoria varia]|nr:MAG: hypothetical protein M1831_007423 [Alyxoria varia]
MDIKPPPSRRSDRSVNTRRHSGLSFRSNRSQDEKSLAPKPAKIDHKDLKETSMEKQGNRFGQSAKNPNTAIHDADPAARNQDESSTLPYLRSVQHRDYKGDVISDPDSSNPVRHRMERPLDTIRSFEAAYDESWKRRSQTPRPDGFDNTSMQSRRTSHNGYEPPYARRHTPGNRDSYQGGGRPLYPNRMSSAPAPHSEHGVYPSHYYQGSHDTVYTGESNGSSEPWGNSTDPSSENSSLDRIQAARQMEYDMYGGAPYARHDAIQEEYGYDQQDYMPGPSHPQSNKYPTMPQNPVYAPQYPQNGNYPPSNHPHRNPQNGADIPPPVPTHAASQTQTGPSPTPMKLGSTPANDPQPTATNSSRRAQLKKKPSDGSKRKSWLMRRFSKE